MGFDSPVIDLSGLGRSAQAARTAQAAATLQSAARGPEGHPIRQAAEEFEAVFLSQMLAPIFEGLETDSLFGGGPGEKIYRSMLVQEFGKSIVRSGGVGIADSVERELLRLQEG
jgi:Rod binding domain-containing protein